MRSVRFVAMFATLVGLSAGCGRCAGIEEEPKVTPAERRASQQKVRLVRPGLLGREAGAARPAESASAEAPQEGAPAAAESAPAKSPPP